MPRHCFQIKISKKESNKTLVNCLFCLQNTSFIVVSMLAVFFASAPLGAVMIQTRYHASTPNSVRALIDPRMENLVQYVQKSLVLGLPSEINSLLNGKTIIIEVDKSLPLEGAFETIKSNQNQLILGIQPDLVLHEDVYQILTHEFFHAIHYLMNPNEEVWIKEGLAQVFEWMVLGRMNGANVKAALLSLSTPLMGYYDYKKINPAQYGHNLLYFYYLFQKCGGSKTFWNIVSGNKTTGPNNINRVLNEFNKTEFLPENPGICKDFDSSAYHFEIARAHNSKDYTVPESQRDDHYLFTTKIDEDISKISQQCESILQLQSYEPKLITFDESLTCADEIKRSRVRVVWLNKSFPFNVVYTEPKTNNKKWKILLIKSDLIHFDESQTL